MILFARWQVAILVYLVFVFCLLAFRPSLLFDPARRAKALGAENSATVSLFAPAFAFPLLAFLSYYLAALTELAWPAPA